MSPNSEIVADNLYVDQKVKDIRKSAVKFFLLLAVLALISHILSIKFMPKDYARAQSTFLGGRLDDLNLIFFNIAVPAIYFGWTTITKILDRLVGSRFFVGHVVILVFYYCVRFIAALYLGFILLPLLVLLNLAKFLFARQLATNKLVQYFS